MKSLTGQIAVITGASSGIGRAIALALATQGTKLCLLGRKLERLEKVAEAANSMSQYAKIYQVDLILEKEIVKCVELIKMDFGHVDILIHSAGIISQGLLADAPREDLDRQYKINLLAPYLLTQALLPVMRLRKGQVVFINSSAGVNARANVGQYAATKHGLKAIADSFREEVNGDGVRVLSLFLGRTATPMQEAVHKMEGKTYRPDALMQPEDIASMVISALSLPRSAEVTDISMRPLMKS